MLARNRRKYARHFVRWATRLFPVISSHVPADVLNGTFKATAYSTSTGTVNFSPWGGVWHNIQGPWDLLIAHPPCTDLAVSGARWFREKQMDYRQQKACVFFMRMMLANAERIAVENPIGIMSTCYRKPDQIIQPWMFGHGETKATCLWLKNLPALVPTDIVKGREQRVWKLPPSAERAKLRSKTYPGIALAMACQWG